MMSRPLGMVGNDYLPMRKEWLPVALAIAGAASSIIGGVKARNAAKAAERRQRAREAEEDAWYNRRYNEDYADTAAGQNLIRRAQEYARENWRKTTGAKAVGGATDAASAMAKEAGNKMVGDTIANMAAQDTARKDRVDTLHRNAREQFAQQDMARETQRANSIQNASQNASNAMLSAAAALGSAKAQQNSPSVSLDGSSNNSKVFINGENAIGLQTGMYTADEVSRLQREIGGL